MSGWNRAIGCCLLAAMAASGCSETPPASQPAAAPSAPAPTTEKADRGAAEPGGGAAADVVDEDAFDPDRVLRHAVFFAFKDTSSEEDVQGVVDAFRALPSKIDAIIDFQWGVNHSPEGHDDGFTHCFLLTFKDEAGRAEYLPHPEHKAFGDVLRPHMADVFVVDYWGKRQEWPEKPLHHAVFFKFQDGSSREEISAIEESFADLPNEIDAIKGFEWGTNNSPEKHDDGFTHCFLVTFESEEGRDAYLPHEAHQAFVQVLTPWLDKARVLDFWGQK